MGEKRKELFKREVEIYEYLYAKTNTKSKKRKIAYDLISFEIMYNMLVEENVNFSWTNDIDLDIMREEVMDKFINNVLKEQDILEEIFVNNYNIFIDEEYFLYADYRGFSYHKLSDKAMIKNIGMFLNVIDSELLIRFRDKIQNSELVRNTNLETEVFGIIFPLEIVNKNIIIFGRPWITCSTWRILW